MRLEQLRYLDAVVRAGSMRRATEALHLSQPALSEALANLERELGVTLLDRARNGARVSEAGRELLPFVAEILDGIDRFRAAADRQRRSTRVLRLGTVNAATVPLLAPAIAEFSQRRPETELEVINARQAEIDDRLREGSLDIGLINRIVGDDPPGGEFDNVELLRGRCVVCFPAASRLATRDAVSVDELSTQPIVAMRAGYVMNRYLRRLFDGDDGPTITCYADGAEMGKVMVAEGVGVTLLPEYSVVGDPLHRSGMISYRPIIGDDTEIVLHAQTTQTRHRTRTVQEMLTVLLKLSHSPEPVRSAPASRRPRATTPPTD